MKYNYFLDLQLENEGVMNMEMLLTNNSRKMAGLPLHRKTNKRKRYFTRCEAMETIGAFLDYCNGIFKGAE